MGVREPVPGVCEPRTMNTNLNTKTRNIQNIPNSKNYKKWVFSKKFFLFVYFVIFVFLYCIYILYFYKFKAGHTNGQKTLIRMDVQF